MTKLFSRLLLGAVLCGAGAAGAAAQANGLCNDVKSETPFFMYENLQGSPSAAAQSYELDTSFVLAAASRLSIAGGLPLYFTRGSTGNSGALERVNATGVGDSYLTFNFKPTVSALAWITCVTVFAPTGNSGLGLGTGRTLFNWNNHLEHDFAAWAPYADLGFANTTIARKVLKHPYTTLGRVGNFDAGAQIGLSPKLTLDFSGYADVPSGPQKVYSRIRRRKRAAAGGSTAGAGSSAADVAGSGAGQRASSAPLKPYQLVHLTIGGPSADRDNGVTAALDLSPRPFLDFGIGYTRSVYQSANIVSFSIGCNVSDLIARF